MRSGASLPQGGCWSPCAAWFRSRAWTSPYAGLPAPPERRAGLHLMLCGGDRAVPGLGSYREHLAGIAAEEGVAAQVIFAGNIDIREVKRYFAAADLQLAPSVIDTFNYGVIEAAMVETHTIASDMVGAGPWVQEVGAAAIVPGRDPEAWGRAIEAFLASGVPPFAGGAISDRLAPQRIAPMLIDLAREVVAGRA